MESLTIVRCLGWEWFADGKTFLRVHAACALPLCPQCLNLEFNLAQGEHLDCGWLKNATEADCSVAARPGKDLIWSSCECIISPTVELRITTYMTTTKAKWSRPFWPSCIVFHLHCFC